MHGPSSAGCPLTLSLSREGRGDPSSHSRQGYMQVRPALSAGVFSGGDAKLFKPLVDSLLEHDPYMLLADYQSYIDCQDQVDTAYRDPQRRTRMSILNVARIGKFSSDRAIREYCEDIWQVRPSEVGAK